MTAGVNLANVRRNYGSASEMRVAQKASVQVANVRGTAVRWAFPGGSGSIVSLRTSGI